MDHTEWEATPDFISKLNLQLPFNISWEIDGGLLDHHLFVLKMPVTCVDTGAPETLYYRIPLTKLTSLEVFANEVRKGIHSGLTHEADELFKIDGQWVCDPHDVGRESILKR